MEMLFLAAQDGWFLNLREELRTEVIRKSLHLLIALIPMIAGYSFSLACSLLIGGLIVYLFSEVLRLQGKAFPLVTFLTNKAARERDQNGLVLGPVSLALGALLSLFLLPAPLSSLAIYALAFGDGLSSLFGKFFHSPRLPFSSNKTLMGSAACLFAVISVASVMGFGFLESAVIALTVTFLEALPLKDLDNVVIPLGTGVFVLLFL